MKINYQHSKLGDRSKTALNVRIEQLITAKISGNALKQGVEYTQRCGNAVNKCKNMLRECLVE